MVETASYATIFNTSATMTRAGKRRSKSLQKLNSDADEASGGGDGTCVPPALHTWYLVDCERKKLRLPRTMLFLGREECDIVVPSGSVDKRHAVITFDHYLSRFKVKDLSTTNGTYVNDCRIPEQEYVTLNHMDSIRLGFDAARYCMEQGELCGHDSPSPPPLPSQPPPSVTDIHRYRDHRVDNDNIHVESGGGGDEEPVWIGVRGVKMAECQGCIAEQRIEHTCSHLLLNPSHNHHHHLQPSSDHHSLPSPHLPHAIHHETDATPDNAGIAVTPELREKYDPESALPMSEPEQQDGTTRFGRNTWPRKKVRQTMHVAAIFDADGPDGASDGSGPILVESGSNYFVSVDDSVVCGEGGRLAEGYSLSRAGSVQRILRNSKQPFPPELETVKKGTPLYGQPSWWGEDTETSADQAMDHSKMTTASFRPSSLVIKPEERHPVHQHHQKGVYMEIPHHSDTTPERDKPPLRDKTTPSRSSTSSNSKDSLQAMSPDQDSAGGCGGEAGPANPALSFTIDFSDEDDKRKARLKSGASLSEFVPPKIRNSLAHHTRGSSSEKSLAAASVVSGGKVSAKNSEEREQSPTRQKRKEELWGVATDVTTSNNYVPTSRPSLPPPPLSDYQGKSARRSSDRATGVPSLTESTSALLSTTSEPQAGGSERERVVIREGRQESEKRVLELDKDLDKKPPKSPRTQDGRKSSPRSRITKAKSTAAAALAASVQSSAYSDPTAFLIDRMFAGVTASCQQDSSPRSDSSERDGAESPVATEHSMYKEARENDWPVQRSGLAYRTSDKPPLSKQKSLSKSPATVLSSPSTSSMLRSTKPSAAEPAATPKCVAASKASTNSKTLSEKPATSCFSDEVFERSSHVSRSPPATRASGSPPSLLLPPREKSPVDDPDQEDKVSEAGTYTIEAEQEGAEEERKARLQIDEVFGVTDVDSFAFERPVIGNLGRLATGAVQVEEGEYESGEERTLHDDDGVGDAGCQTPCDDDGNEVFDNDEENEEQAMSAGCGEEEVPSWITQLNALTAAANSKSPPRDKEKSDDTEDGNHRCSNKGGPNRKRPGTGRKLPSIPLVGSQQSPVDSEHSSHFQNNSPDSVNTNGTVNAGPAPTRLQNGNGHSMTDSPLRVISFSPAVSSRKSRLTEDDRSSASDDSASRSTKNDNGKGFSASSVRSRGSLDTEVLLRDTETVMAAMEARMFVQRDDNGQGCEDDGGGREDAGSDTDLSSTVAMVNGDDDYVKPSKYCSPREALTSKSKKDRDSANVLVTSSHLPPTATSSGRKSLARSTSEHKSSLRSVRSGMTGVSVVSDILSRENSLDQSFQSDTSDACSDRTDGSNTRQGSRGKGTITNTKPNRAFTLRRARADGSDVATDSSRSRTSAVSLSSSASTASSTASYRRSSSIHGTSRTLYSDRTTGRSEASLGAQIAKKAQDNARIPSKTRDVSVPRMDSSARQVNRRSSGDLRTITPSSVLSSTSSLSAAAAKKDRDIRSLKTKLKSAPGVSRDLAITGVGSRSQSQPGSRSNSPKAAERMAWKRRKEYDPRKAVAEAKEKDRKRESRPPKAQSSSYSSKQKMIRSASFTNTLELSSSRKRHDTFSVDSNSSVEDLSSAATATETSCAESGFRRAFVLFQNPLRVDRLSHSADEDETGTFPTSQDTATTTTTVSKRPTPAINSMTLMLKSAFTPPLSKLTPSPDTPPPPSVSLLLRRRTLGGCDFDESGASTASVSHRTQADSHRTQSNSPQSYDSLIVSSVYQLSLKLKTNSDKMLKKLREQNRVSITPSPIDDFLGHSAKSDIPAWKSANQELAGVLKNLRKMEHHLHLIERALFPEEDTDMDVSGMSSIERHKYFQEIERIRSELAGFQPIDSPRNAPPVNQDPASPEMDELTGQIF